MTGIAAVRIGKNVAGEQTGLKAAMISRQVTAVLRYGFGLPHYCQEKPQDCAEVPTSDGSFFDMSVKFAKMTGFPKAWLMTSVSDFTRTAVKKIMDELQSWYKSQLEDKKVEPNNNLGKAINYLENHWHVLTQFLRFRGS